MRVFTTVYSRWQGIVACAVLFLLWAGASYLYPAVILPSPPETVRALGLLLDGGQLAQTLSVTFLRLAAGFGLAFAIGTGLGVAAGLHEQTFRFVRPVVALFQAVPPVSWILLAILWLGVNGGAQIFVVITALFPVFFFNSVQGIRQVPRDLLEMAAVYRVPLRKRVRDIYLPSFRPYWSSAIMINIGNGWKSIVMSELVSGQTGVGAAMNTARLYLKTDEVMAWTLLVALLGISLEWAAGKYFGGKRTV